MTLRMTSGTGLIDPFVAALRARRPDIDVVVLPRERPPTATPACDGEQSGEAADRAVRFVLASLPGLAPRSAGWWDTAAGVVRPRRVLTGHGEPDDLDGLAFRLIAERWRVRRGRRVYDRLVADHDGLDLVATYADGGAVTLTVLGPRTAAPTRGGR